MNKLNRALYKALQASGMKIRQYGTVLATIADEDKEEVLPLMKRFYQLGFSIQATAGNILQQFVVDIGFFIQLYVFYILLHSLLFVSLYLFVVL